MSSFSNETISTNNGTLCPKQDAINASINNYIIGNATEISTFESVWNLYTTVPVFLGIVMFPLLNFKSATFFTKFNSLGKLWTQALYTDYPESKGTQSSSVFWYQNIARYILILS